MDLWSGISSAKGRTPKSKIAPLVSLTPSNINDVGYFVSLELVYCLLAIKVCPQPSTLLIPPCRDFR
jgi:hypothetical protein